MPSERIDKILSGQGICSRRDCPKLIRDGRVLVDGVPASSPSQKCDPSLRSLTVDGNPVNYREHVYYMMHKPAGVLSASSDKRDRTVIDLLPESLSRRRGLFPAGRLDRDTEGLLIITDDGDFAHRMLSPSCHVEKTYFLTADKDIPEAAAGMFAEGVYIDGGYLTRPARLEILSPREALLTITEGKYHQVKLMMKKVGCTVTYLRRVRIGGLSLPGDLPPGGVRELSPEQAMSLLSVSRDGQDAS